MRHHALDTARVVAMGIVITAHAALAYMETPIGWAVQDPARTIAADLYVWIARSMVIPLFFWLAGFLSRVSYEGVGTRAFLRGRLLRIGLPLAIALIPCSLAMNALWDWGREVMAREPVPAHIPVLEPSTLPVTLGHLWFLYYLLAMSLAAPAIARLRVRIPPLAATAVALIPPLVVGKLQVDTPLGFLPDLAVLAYMGAFFAWGWQVHREQDHLARAARRVWLDLAGAAILLGVLIPALLSGNTAPHVILCSGLFGLFLVDATIGLCVRYGNRPSRAIRVASDASYVVYVVHLPLLVLAQILIASR
jgi:glucans biosynthesis protein C